MNANARSKLSVFARTYALALLITFLGRGKRMWHNGRLLRDTGPSGFAFAMAVAVAGGRLVRDHFPSSNTFKFSEWQKTFLANLFTSSVGISLLHRSFKKRTAWSFDLTLFLVVRAADSLVSRTLLACADHSEGDHEKRRQTLQGRQSIVDAILFQLSAARVMWCFFYRPSVLPNGMPVS